MSARTRRILLVAAVALVALLVPAAAAGVAASASGPAVTKERQPFTGFYYGDFDAELLLLSGEPFNSDSCLEVNSPIVTKLYRERRDGTWVERWRSVQRVSLYRTPLGGPEYEEQQCAAIAAGADPPEPFATGRGLVRSYVDGLASPDGPPTPGARVVNRTFGIVRDDDGRRYLVKAQADLVLDENLAPVGSPTEFQSLHVRRLGPWWWR